MSQGRTHIGSSADYMTLEFGLRLSFTVTHTQRTVLRLSCGRIIPRNTGRVLPDVVYWD